MNAKVERKTLRLQDDGSHAAELGPLPGGDVPPDRVRGWIDKG